MSGTPATYGKPLVPCRHCEELVAQGPTGGWIDRNGWTYCQKRLPHEPLPEGFR